MGCIGLTYVHNNTRVHYKTVAQLDTKMAHFNVFLRSRNQISFVDLTLKRAHPTLIY